MYILKIELLYSNLIIFPFIKNGKLLVSISIMQHYHGFRAFIAQVANPLALFSKFLNLFAKFCIFEQDICMSLYSQRTRRSLLTELFSNHATWIRCNSNTMALAWIHQSISKSIVLCSLDHLQIRFLQGDIFRISNIQEEL